MSGRKRTGYVTVCSLLNSVRTDIFKAKKKLKEAMIEYNIDGICIYANFGRLCVVTRAISLSMESCLGEVQL